MHTKKEEKKLKREDLMIGNDLTIFFRGLYMIKRGRLSFMLGRGMRVGWRAFFVARMTKDRAKDRGAADGQSFGLNAPTRLCRKEGGMRKWVM